MQIEQLVKKCIKNNKRAQHELYTLLAPVVFGVCQRYATNSYQADDLFQDTFIRVFNKLDKWNPDKGSIEGWVSRLAVNVALAQYRDKHLRASEEINESFDRNLETPTIDDELSYEDTMNLVNELPDKQKLVFNMFVVEGYSHKDIAEMMQIDEGTSRSQLNKARKFLQIRLSALNSVE